MQTFNAVSNYRYLYGQNSKVPEGSASSASQQHGFAGNDAGSRVVPPETRRASSPAPETDRVTISEAARRAAADADVDSDANPSDGLVDTAKDPLTHRQVVETSSEDAIDDAAQLLAWSSAPPIADLPLSWVTRQLLGMQPGLDATALSRSQTALHAVSDTQRAEYVTRLHAHYERSLTDAGVIASNVHLNSVMSLDRQVSERVRRALTHRINTDTALQQLREAIG